MVHTGFLLPSPMFVDHTLTQDCFMVKFRGRESGHSDINIKEEEEDVFTACCCVPHYMHDYSQTLPSCPRQFSL